MSKRRWPRRMGMRGSAALSARRTFFALLLILVATVVTVASLAFRSLVTELAVSTAKDAVIMSVNSIVKDIMTDESFDPSALVGLERSADGGIAAVTTNVAAVNTLAARVLERAIEQTAAETISVSIPLGNLAGSTLLAGKGPSIPVELTMLSSSVAGFRSELTSAGINQTRHQILLDLNVEVSLLMPWRTVGTSVDTEILVSETVIVGEVPESYLNWRN